MRHAAEKVQLTLESNAIQRLAETCLIRWPSKAANGGAAMCAV